MEESIVKGASDLKLIQYRVIKTSFVLNQAYKAQDEVINISPNFTRNIEKVDDNNFKVILGVSILKETNKNQIPFEAEVIIDATFSFENWEGPTKLSAITNSTAILFPYLRSVLSAVTLNGNIAPYTLPVMNINRLFAQSDDTKTND